MGYGGFGHSMFLELDMDESGSISYGELLKMLKQRNARIGLDTKRLLTALAFNDAREIDVTQWHLSSTDPESLRVELQQMLMLQSARVTDLYRLFTTGRGGEPLSLTRELFVQSLKSSGFAGSEEVLHACFDRIDLDRSHVIGVTELV